MNRILPILFNGDMVRGILENRKTATRRVVKYARQDIYDAACTAGKWNESYGQDIPGHLEEWYIKNARKAPYRPGDILYVRETFCFCPCWDCGLSMEEGACAESGVYEKVYNAKRWEWGCWCYRASCDVGEEPSVDTWHPSIHMPKEIARIWLRVTDVRVERLQDITEEQAEAEGCGGYHTECKFSVSPCCHFMEVWDSTVNKRDADRYGWVANPWVWVIEFEKCGKPEPCLMKGIEPAEDKRPCIGYGDEWADEPCEMCKGCALCSGNM